VPEIDEELPKPFAELAGNEFVFLINELKHFECESPNTMKLFFICSNEYFGLIYKDIHPHHPTKLNYLSDSVVLTEV